MRKTLLLLLMSVFWVSVSAQQLTNPGLSFKKTFMDYMGPTNGSYANFNTFRSGFEVGYSSFFKDNFRVYVPIRFGIIELASEHESLRKILTELDLQIHYKFNDRPNKLASPYLVAGLGGVAEDFDEFNAQIPLGIGFDFKISSRSYINIQGDYRISFLENRNNIQIGIGWTYHFFDSPESVEEKEDSDGDGVPDEIDLCPGIPGLAAFSGCPDSDNDGIEDPRDECPRIPGLKHLKGCPDTDGDGISDKDDECPNLAGIAANNGCPGSDADNDGVLDNQDDCPNEAGPASANGCPDADGDGIGNRFDKCPNIEGIKPSGCPDTDGDGIDDSVDRCPNIAGPISNKGCPELNEQEKEMLLVAMRDVQFDHNRATLKTSSFPVLNQIEGLMRRYPGYILRIGGHTDNTGPESINLRMSDQRAKACYNYLISKGISAERMSFKGYGESEPIDTNDSASGRARNRRVEFNLIIE